jgi:methionyl-tRNA formyltransferase
MGTDTENQNKSSNDISPNSPFPSAIAQDGLGGLRIVFMGTPEFAVASLDALVKSGCNIVGVITAPDKPAGRGMELQQSAVKKYAVENNLHVLQPEKLKNPEFIEELKALNADLQIVVAFRMLPEVVWNMPPMGSVNLHGSLLPQYRGAAPINWAVINGEKETGVTTFKLKHEIDTGDILLQESFPIAETDNAGDVHDRMKEIGAVVLVKTIEGLAAGTLNERPQTSEVSGESSGTNSRLTTHDSRLLNHAPKIFTETCKIDWNKPVDEVYNLIRGLAPYPAAFTFLQEKKLKIYKAEKIHESSKDMPGSFITDSKSFLHFTCNDGFVSITELQLEGKKKMNIADFLRGYRF